MKLTRLSPVHPWADRAEEYRALADRAADALARLGYLQLANYCDTMARREAIMDTHQSLAAIHPSAASASIDEKTSLTGEPA